MVEEVVVIESFDTLIRERIPDGPYALFWCTGEGAYLPNGDEESSGYAIVPSGETWFWWTGWDAEQQRVTLTTWERVPISTVGSYDLEYREARAEVGLA
jgi:hypothetical protein